MSDAKKEKKQLIFDVLERIKTASTRFGLRTGFRSLKPHLRSIQLNITDYCPCKCIMCNHWKMATKYEMCYSDVLSILTEARELGCESVIFSGGEPFMHKDFLSILESILALYKVGVITTGIWPKKYYSKSGVLEKISWIRLSIDSFNPDEYERIRGARIDKALESLEFVYGHKIDLRINMCNLGQNYALEKLDLDVPYAIFDIVEYGVDQTLSLHPIGWNKVCIVPFYHCVVTANGNVYPCCYLSFDNNDEILENAALGNIHEESFKDIWLGNEATRLRRRLVKGEFFDICRQCMRYNTINTTLIAKEFI